MASVHSSLASGPRERAPIRDLLDKALAGARLSDADAIALIECPDSDLDAILSAAAELRDRGKGRDVTYSRKVFCRSPISAATDALTAPSAKTLATRVRGR